MKFTTQFICLLYLTVIGVPVSAQIVIGTTTPSPSAVLELNSTSAGFLVPRMTYAQMNAIASPAEGLTVYCIDCEPKGLYYYDGAQFLNGVTGSEPGVVPITSATGRIWMDRNLGAAQVATSSADAASYGDLYQWGRATDGHEKRTSGTITITATTPEPGLGNDWDGKFIISSTQNWLSSSDNSLWQGVNGTNNPCPKGYRLPTESEWMTEYSEWTSQNTSGAYASSLKLTSTGSRTFNGLLLGAGNTSYYWSSSINGTNSIYVNINSSNTSTSNSSRGYGYSVRCIKED